MTRELGRRHTWLHVSQLSCYTVQICLCISAYLLRCIFTNIHCFYAQLVALSKFSCHFFALESYLAILYSSVSFRGFHVGR
jgi:hypothetical protein